MSVCAGTITNLSLTIGAAETHVTLVDANTCVQQGPAGVTLGGAALSGAYISATPDATGWQLLGLIANPADLILTLTFSESGGATTQISLTVVPSIILGVTSP